MKKMKKIVAFMLVAFLALSVFGNQGVYAGAYTEPEYICDYTPEIKLEAMIDNTAIKVTIPEQAYIDDNKYVGKYYSEGYEITLLLDPSDERMDVLGSVENLYSTYYPKLPKSGYGPYGIGSVSEINKANVIKEDGTEKRTYVYTDLDPGKYIVRVRAYANGDYVEFHEDQNGEIYETYRPTTFWSKAAENSISLNPVKAAEIKTGYKTKYDFSKVKKGDTIKFGSYEQDGNIMNGREPIEWIVLAKTKKQMLVVSKNNLDMLPYNSGSEPVTWADCSLRLWLNDSFYNTAFNKSEQKLIPLTTLKNEANPSTGVSAGKNTKDKVFILSLQDVTNSSYGFSKKLLTHDALRRSTLGFDANTGGRWWLRTPAKDVAHVLFVGSEGGLEYEYGVSLMSWNTVSLGVRPAIYIKLK